MPQGIEGKQFVSCFMKLQDFRSNNLFFSKIKFGKKVEKGLLVQMAIDPNCLEEQDNSYKVTDIERVIYYPTHEIQLVE